MFETVREDYDRYLYTSFVWVPDYKRRSEFSRRLERWDAIVFRGLWPSVCLYRFREWASARGVPLLPWLAEALNRLMFKVIIGKDVKIGPGFCISHGDIVIDGIVRIGRNCTVNPFVTIGLATGSDIGLSFVGPTMGDNVYVGTGAKVLGPITIGDNAKIGANAVVLSDVPAGHTAVGVPARTFPSKPPKKRAHPAKNSAAASANDPPNV